MINSIIFDIGNVLAGFQWYEYLRESGYEDTMIQRIGRATVHQPLWKELDRSEQITESLIKQFQEIDNEIAEDIKYFLKNSAKAVREYSYAVNLIDALHEEGYKVYLLSNYNGENYQYAKEQFKFINRVDGAVISYEVGHVKPEKIIYQTLLDRYGIEGSRAVFLDDLQLNVEGAKACGIHGIVFHNLEQGLEELQQLGVRCSL